MTPTVTLNDDNVIPVVGLGVAELSEDETERAVAAALEAGYRLIDTAAAYGNEAAVGRAIAASGIPARRAVRDDQDRDKEQGYNADEGRHSPPSLERLGLDYVDMYMIHWPAAQLGDVHRHLRSDAEDSAGRARSARSASATSSRST